MRKFYKNRRNRVVSLLKNCSYAEKLTILELDAGLHFLVKVDTRLSDRELTAQLERSGIRIMPLSSYYHFPAEESRHIFLVNYSVLDEKALEEALNRLTITL